MSEYKRVWCMPHRDTFTIEPIKELVNRYRAMSSITIDPFARNNQWATYNNDINPDTKARHHMLALDFLKMLLKDGVKADCIFFDPPYSANQAKTTYGIESFTLEDAQNVVRWTKEKDVIDQLLLPGGYFIHFGWHSNGLGLKRYAKVVEGLLVCHGGAHYDTIVTVEKKTHHQIRMFD